MGGADPASGEAVRILHDGCGYALGEFRCRPGDPRWRQENWIGTRWHLVVPGPAVWIEPVCQDPVLATANEVLCYPPDTHYWRRLAAPVGDRCVFIAVDNALAEELRLAVDRPVRLRQSSLPAPTYAASLLLARALRRLDLAALAADERVLGLLQTLAVRHEPARSDRPDSRQRDVIEQVKSVLAERTRVPVRLAAIAAVVNYSQYHLARMFRAHTGTPMYAYLQQLRLRESLEPALDGSRSLADIATDYGFASHSHYTRTFRQTFGAAPSRLRGNISRAPSRAALSSRRPRADRGRHAVANPDQLEIGDEG